jgi:hypothetical protein
VEDAALAAGVVLPVVPASPALADAEAAAKPEPAFDADNE